jgi:uncharacterized membrane protein
MRRQLYDFAALGVLLGFAGPAKADYIFTTLDGYEATGINDSGQIVGLSDYGGFLYSGGVYTRINFPDASRFSATFPFGIINAGQVVGAYYDGATEIYHGFLLSGGSYRTFNPPGSSYAIAWGINGSGQIAGSYRTGGLFSPDHGFVLSGGTFTTVDVPGSISTLANGINNLGQIVGKYYAPSSNLHFPKKLHIKPPV